MLLLRSQALSPAVMSTRGSHTGGVEGEKVDVNVEEYADADTPDEKDIVKDTAPPVLTPEQEKKLWRKVDMRILPILTTMYLCSFMDRGEGPRSDSTPY